MIRPTLLIAVLAVGPALAEDVPKSKLAVDFTSVSGTAWFASALEEQVAAGFSQFHQIEIQEKADAVGCPEREARCLVALYRGLDVRVVVLGRLFARRLDYEVYETAAGTRAFSGTLEITDASSAALKRHIGEIVRPITQQGGVLQRRAPAITQAPESAIRPGTIAGDLFPFGLLILVAIPLLFARRAGRRDRPRSWKWSAGIGFGLALWVFAHSEIGASLPTVAVPSRVTDLALPIVAGMMWGIFILWNLRWLFPPIDGLSQIRHEMLWPLLRSWLALALLRIVVAALYVPILALAYRFSPWPARETLGLALPVAGLFACFWLLSLVDNLAFRLDATLVAGAATEANSWHATLKRYLLGYVKRDGVVIDAGLLARTLFLPGRVPSVRSYGGGFARPRIVVSEAIIRSALGDLPDGTELERTMNPEELPLGYLVPRDHGDRGRRIARRAAALRSRLTLAPARPQAPKPRVFGEKTTALGWVLPQPFHAGDTMAPISSGEFAEFRGGLKEHYKPFEERVLDEEVEERDSTELDFLFGALIREIGTVSRGDTILGTIGHGLASIARFVPARQMVRIGRALHDRLLARPAIMVADAASALNQGLHPLIQYLRFLQDESSALLTARADEPRLLRTSKEILDQLGREKKERGFFPTPRNRILWLAPYFYAPRSLRRSRWPRMIGVVLALAVSGAVAARAVQAAIDYHPTYVARMRALQVAPNDQGAAHGRPLQH